jgi:hypothetical protein
MDELIVVCNSFYVYIGYTLITLFMKNLSKIMAITAISLWSHVSYAQWSLSGNSIATGNFLGTTNNEQLLLKRNSAHVFSVSTGNAYLLGPQSFVTQTGDYSFAIGSFTTSLGMGNIQSNRSFTIGNYAQNITQENSFSIGNYAQNACSDGIDNFSIGNSVGFIEDQTIKSFIIGNDIEISGGFNKTFSMGNNISGNSSSKSFYLGNEITINGGTNRFLIGSGVSSSSTISNTIDNSMVIGFNSNIPTLFVGPSAGLNTTGNVGIGTTTPVEKLGVNGNINMAGVTGRRVYMGAAGSTFGIAYDNSNPNYGFFYTEGSPDFVSISPNGNETNGVVNIFGDYRVGIATATPGEKLEVNGNIKLSNKTFDIMWPLASSYAGGITGDDNASAASTKLTLYHGNEIMFQTGSNTVDAAYNRVVIDGQGQMGIGALSPGFKLDVDGDINFPLANSLKIGGTDVLKYKYTNFLLGFGAGASFISTNYYNTVVGTRAGNTAYSDQNTIIGYDAAYNAVYHPSGSTGDNVIIGYLAANNMDLSNAEIGRNTYVGSLVSTAAIGSENVHLGYLSGDRTTGNQNAYVGVQAGASTTGSNNIAMGYKTEIRGSRNSILGNEAKAYNPFTGKDVTGSVALGTDAWVFTDNTIVLGDPNTLVGVEIGFNSSGQALIAGIPFACKFEVNGDAYAAGLWFPSDANLKKNIAPLTNGMDILRDLKPVNYEYRDDIYVKQPEGAQQSLPAVKRNFTKGKQYGFLAQDIEKVIPDMVATRDDGTKMINYNQLFGVLVKGVQEQDVILSETKAEMDALRSELRVAHESNEMMIELVKDMQHKLDELTTIVNQKFSGTRSYIQQTEPNPFSEQTIIKYNVAQFAKEASLVITDDKAQQLFSFPIDQRGFGQIMLSSNSLKQGAYIVQLIIDGTIEDTKKILLIK